MKNSIIKKAFSLAEVLLVLVISGVIAMFFVKAAKTAYTHYNNNLMSYSAFDSLSTAAYDLAQGVGCTTTPSTGDVDMTYCTTQYSLPVIGHNAASRGLCDRLVNEEFNTVGTSDCSKTTTSSFITSNINFTTSNGMRFFNFGSTPSSSIYTVYVDIDGSKRNGVENQDVLKFLITTNGDVIPAADSVAATSKDYITASVRYNNSGTYAYPLSGVTYQEAICKATPAVATAIDGTYCDSYTTQVSPCDSQTCEVVLDKPGLLGN